MATEKENTLQIKDFRGVNRFADGTSTPPNEAYTLQGYHPKSRSELASIGYQNSVGSSVPGVARWVGFEWLKTGEGRDKLLGFFVPDVSTFSMPTMAKANFTGLVVGANSNNFVVSYVGPGGIVWTQAFNYSLSNYLAPGDTFTFVLPSLPSFVAQVDVYIANSGGLGLNAAAAWCGSAHRGPSGLPTQVVCFVPADGVSATAISANSAIRPDTVWVDPSTDSPLWTGNALVPGRRYYLGIAAHMALSSFLLSSTDLSDYRGIRASVISSVSSDDLLSFECPKSASPSVQLRLSFANRPAGSNDALQVKGVDVLRFVPFIGCTPEDMHAVGDQLAQAQNRVTSVAMTSLRYVFVSADATAETVELSNELTEALRDGDRIFLASSSSGNLPAGLSNDTAYWIKIVGKAVGPASTTVKLATTKANLDAGTFVNLTTAGSSYASHKVYLQRCVFNVSELPRNSRNSLEWTDNVAHIGTAIAVAPADNSAIASRTDAYFRNSLILSKEGSVPTAITADSYKYGDSVLNPADFSTLFAGSGGTWSLSALPFLGCWAMDALTFAVSTAHQLLPDVNQRSFSKLGSECLLVPNQVPSLNLFWNPRETAALDQTIEAVQYAQRLFLANGENTIWYTNGFVLQPIRHNDGTAVPPTSKFLNAIQDMLVACGGADSFQNSRNVGYHSEPASPFNWGATINTLSMASAGEFNGVGGYSQNLLDSSFNTFAVFSKEDGLFVWDGNPANGPQQIYYSFGFASPKAFVVTDYAPLFVARDNVYIIGGKNFQINDIGDEFKDVLEAMTDDQLKRIEVVYHERRVKILYPESSSDTTKNRELWVEMRTENQQLQRFWSGPHIRSALKNQVAMRTFASTRSVRMACGTDGAIYRLDQDGVSYARKIIFNRLGMNADHFWKILTRIYLSTKIAANETFTLTLDGEEASAQYVGTLAQLVASGTRQFGQHILTERFRGRVNQLTIEHTSAAASSIFDISMLFNKMRRRELNVT